MSAAVILAILAVAAIFVRADLNPTSPGPGDVFIQGNPCTISWDVDQTGVWKSVNIDLMTGNNYDMIFLTSVATNVDGTDPSKNTFSYTCPQVSPFSPIYFYQFSPSSITNKTWTARFTITDSANDIVPPSQSTQPDGENIPWGIGSLVNGSSTAPSASVSSIANATTSSASSTSSVSSTFSSSTSTQSASQVTSAAPATTSKVSSTSANGGGATLSVSNIFQTGLVLAALGFTVMF